MEYLFLLFPTFSFFSSVFLIKILSRIFPIIEASGKVIDDVAN